MHPKAIRTQAEESIGLPIPVSRLAGVDTIEDIFEIGKRAGREPDMSKSQEEDHDKDGSLATPHKHRRTLHPKEAQSSSLADSPGCTSSTEDPCTPLLVSSIDSPSTASPNTPRDPLETPVLPPFCPRGETPDSKKTHRVFGILVNRSPSRFADDDIELDDDVSYLRSALGMAHVESPPTMHDPWQGPDERVLDSKDVIPELSDMSEDQGGFRGWVFPGRQVGIGVEASHE